MSNQEQIRKRVTMKVWAASVDDHADVYQFIVFARDRKQAEKRARDAYCTVASDEDPDELDIGLTEVQPKEGYYFFG